MDRFKIFVYTALAMLGAAVALPEVPDWAKGIIGVLIAGLTALKALLANPTTGGGK